MLARSPHRPHLIAGLALAALLAGCGPRAASAPTVQARPAADAAPAPAELAFRGELRLAPGDPPHLEAQATATNTGDVPARVEFGACALRLRAYPASGGGGEPAWRSERRQPWESTALYACDLSLFVRELGPGESTSPGQFAVLAPLVEVLGDSLPDGRYRFTGSVEVNRRWSAEFPLGEAELRLERPPLPASRTTAFLAFRAEPVRVAGSPPALAAHVEATRPDPGSGRVDLPACVLTLWAFRDRARRDAAPRSGAPDWTSAPLCDPEPTRTVLRGGQTMDFDLRVPASRVLGAGRPPGRYHFVAVVQTATQRVFLSAGEATLAR